MKPLALFLGFVTTVVVGVMQYNRFVTGTITASVEHKYSDHPCKALGIAVDMKSPPLPASMTLCPAGVQIPADERWQPAHLPAELVEAAMPADSLAIEFTELDRKSVV